MAEVLNLYQKLAKIRKQVEVVQKNKSGYGYKYVTDDELLAKITVGMDKYGVSLVPNIVPGTLNVAPYTYKKTKREKQKDGTYATYEETVNEFTAVCDMAYIWVNNDNPEETITVSWSMVGQQSDASQCLGSGLTYSMRYFLLKYFNVATPDDDPDNWRSKQKATEAAEDKALAEQIINTLNTQQKDGAIVLMHENYNTTATAMETLIPQLVAEGWQIVSVSELFKAKGLELKDGSVYNNAK